MAPLKGELSPPFTAVTEGLPLRFCAASGSKPPPLAGEARTAGCRGRRPLRCTTDVFLRRGDPCGRPAAQRPSPAFAPAQPQTAKKHGSCLDFFGHSAYNSLAWREATRKTVIWQSPKNESPGSGNSQGILPFCQAGRFTGRLAALLPIQPFADVVCDYTCQDGENE